MDKVRDIENKMDFANSSCSCKSEKRPHGLKQRPLSFDVIYHYGYYGSDIVLKFCKARLLGALLTYERKVTKKNSNIMGY